MVLSIMRSKKFKRRALGLLAVIFIPAFLFWGVSGSLSNRQPVIGQISGKNIMANDFAKSREAMKVQVILSNFQNYQSIQKILQNRELLNYMAWERLILLDEAKRKKIEISNQDVIGFISTHPLFQKNGSFNKTVYKQILQNSLFILPRDFEEYVRQNLAVQKVRQDILKDTDVSEKEIVDFYNKNFGSVNCSYLLFDKKTIKDTIEVTDSDLLDYYELYKDNFYEPAKIDIEYVQIPYSAVAQQEQARKKLTSFYSKVISGNSSFKETALSMGLDYKNPETFSSETLLDEIPYFSEFYETAFPLNDGDISSSIYSDPESGNAYIIKKIKNYPRIYKTFDEMKPLLKEPALEKKTLEASKKQAEEAYSIMLTQGLSLEELSDKFNIPVKTSGKIKQDGYIENFGPTGELIYGLENASVGETIPPLVSLKGTIIARLEERYPPEEKDFAEKKDRIKNLLLVRKQTQVLDEWFKARTDRAELKTDLKEM